MHAESTNSIQTQRTKNLFSGNLSFSYVCSKNQDQYCLYRMEQRNGPVGWIVKEDLTEEIFGIKFNGSNFFELRLGKFPSPLVFVPGDKVLSLKPTAGDLFTVKFYPATIVSKAKECKRDVFNEPGINTCNVRTDKTRHQYEVRFDNEQGKTYNVYEELIVPIEEDWKIANDK